MTTATPDASTDPHRQISMRLMARTLHDGYARANLAALPAVTPAGTLPRHMNRTRHRLELHERPARWRTLGRTHDMPEAAAEFIKEFGDLQAMGEAQTWGQCQPDAARIEHLPQRLADLVMLRLWPAAQNIVSAVPPQAREAVAGAAQAALEQAVGWLDRVHTAYMMGPAFDELAQAAYRERPDPSNPASYSAAMRRIKASTAAHGAPCAADALAAELARLQWSSGTAGAACTAFYSALAALAGLAEQITGGGHQSLRDGATAAKAAAHKALQDFGRVGADRVFHGLIRDPERAAVVDGIVADAAQRGIVEAGWEAQMRTLGQVVRL